jgi:hypothetical protein
MASTPHISPGLAKTVRDKFYPKSMLQLDEVKGLNEMMQDDCVQVPHAAAHPRAAEGAVTVAAEEVNAKL